MKGGRGVWKLHFLSRSLSCNWSIIYVRKLSVPCYTFKCSSWLHHNFLMPGNTSSFPSRGPARLHLRSYEFLHSLNHPFRFVKPSEIKVFWLCSDFMAHIDHMYIPVPDTSLGWQGVFGIFDVDFIQFHSFLEWWQSWWDQSRLMILPHYSSCTYG